MASLMILGTANAMPDGDHENSHMAVIGDEGTVLIDCVGTPSVRLGKAGIPIGSITDVIATHFHPDHVAGIPLLLMSMWLGGRQAPLRIYGLHHCLERIEYMMGAYRWEDWPDFFPVAFHRLPEREMVPVLEQPGLAIFSTPVRHLVPTIGVRVEGRPSGKVVAYSCDTEPYPALIRLAHGADVLIHEASGVGVGHSSARQAGEVAHQAEVSRLLLIHYPPVEADFPRLLDEARQGFGGEVGLAEDFMQIDL
jgi:ribonuclease Z